MQKGAQYQAVWELISEIFKDKIPADNIINAYVRERKYIGSKDRRFFNGGVVVNPPPPAANWYLMPVQTSRGGFC